MVDKVIELHEHARIAYDFMTNLEEDAFKKIIQIRSTSLKFKVKTFYNFRKFKFLGCDVFVRVEHEYKEPEMDFLPPAGC